MVSPVVGVADVADQPKCPAAGRFTSAAGGRCRDEGRAASRSEIRPPSKENDARGLLAAMLSERAIRVR